MKFFPHTALLVCLLSAACGQDGSFTSGFENAPEISADDVLNRESDAGEIVRITGTNLNQSDNSTCTRNPDGTSSCPFQPGQSSPNTVPNPYGATGNGQAHPSNPNSGSPQPLNPETPQTRLVPIAPPGAPPGANPGVTPGANLGMNYFPSAHWYLAATDQLFAVGYGFLCGYGSVRADGRIDYTSVSNHPLCIRAQDDRGCSSVWFQTKPCGQIGFGNYMECPVSRYGQCVPTGVPNIPGVCAAPDFVWLVTEAAVGCRAGMDHFPIQFVM